MNFDSNEPFFSKTLVFNNYEELEECCKYVSKNYPNLHWNDGTNFDSIIMLDILRSNFQRLIITKNIYHKVAIDFKTGFQDSVNLKENKNAVLYTSLKSKIFAKVISV